jgi:antitoxin FitA
MPDVLIRGLDDKTFKRLKARARRHGRSLQKEAKLALEQAAGSSSGQVAEMFDAWKKRFTGRKFSSSVHLIREDRSR